MRNFSKNKLLLCFRPVDHIDAMLESKVAAHRSASCRFPCIPVSEKHGMTKISENKPVMKFSKSWILQHPPKRTISKVIKAVVFETILNRRARQKKGYGSKQNYPTYKEITKTSQSSLSSLSSHGSTYSSSSESSPKVLLSQSKNCSSTKEKQNEGSGGDQVEKQKKFEFYAICLVLISLAFTVFWGKTFGIILTSIWLYFFSFWKSSSSYRCQKMVLTCPRQSVQCRDKGVIMEGRSVRSELP